MRKPGGDLAELLHEAHPGRARGLLGRAVAEVPVQDLHGLVARGDGVVEVELLLHEPPRNQDHKRIAVRPSSRRASGSTSTAMELFPIQLDVRIEFETVPAKESFLSWDNLGCTSISLRALSKVS